MGKNKKYSKSFLRDARFYLKNRHKFSFFGGNIPFIEFDKDEIDGLRCFWHIDSQGKYLPTKHPRIIKSLLRTKKSVNWHLKAWADGYEDMLMGTQEYLDEFIDYPNWVEESFRKLIYKNYKNNLEKNKTSKY